MNIRLKDLKCLNQKGVYALINTKNQKVYIGSTSVSFYERLKIHEMRLRNQNHENKYLQKAWNKDKIYFEFRILLITLDNFKWEQRAIDLYQPFQKRGYNMNKIANSPPKDLSKKTILKRSSTFKATFNAAMNFYYEVKSNNLKIEDVPDKYKNIVISRLTFVPWNKGLSMDDNHKKKLSLAASNRKQTEEGLLSRRKAFKDLSKSISVYKDDVFIKDYENCDELIEDESLEQYVSEFKAKRGKKLKKPNIYQSCRTGKPYKGLNFKYNAVLDSNI
jgi:hypothetical protein